MGEAAATLTPCRLADVARPSFDRYLTRRATAPLIVAFSGGGDSLALLLGAKAWAEGAGRRLLAVTVDHRLQHAGAAWAVWCAARCARLAVEHHILDWTGDKPATGVAAAARAARHALIADAARAAGARVILMGHTADDRLEAGLMRAEGGSVSEPREWAPSPIWPEGRDLFILRPLIEARRAALREILGQVGETWIEDPANDDFRQPRARARAALTGGGEADSAESCSGAPGLLEYVTEGATGDLAISRDVLRQAPRDSLRALVGAVLLCVAGTARPPRGERLGRLIARLRDEPSFVATLAGARVEAGERFVGIARETGDRRRAGAALLPLPVGAAVVWDGRFEIVARAPGLAVAALGGLARHLDRAGRQALKGASPAARPGLPALVDETGAIALPSLVADARVTVRGLVFSRLAGALGAIQAEAAIGRVAERLATS